MIRIRYNPAAIGWEVYEYRGNKGYREFRTNKGEWVKIHEGAIMHEPTMIIEDLQEWAVAIRDAGVKLPSDHKLEGILEAQKSHLEDMRKLVFRSKK